MWNPAGNPQSVIIGFAQIIVLLLVSHQVSRALCVYIAIVEMSTGKISGGFV